MAAAVLRCAAVRYAVLHGHGAKTSAQLIVAKL